MNRAAASKTPREGPRAAVPFLVSRTVIPMKFLTAALALSLLTLAGCAEINKPITPGDPWRETATRDSNSLPR